MGYPDPLAGRSRMNLQRRTLLATAAGALVFQMLPRAAEAAGSMRLGAMTHFSKGQSTAILGQARAAGLPLTFVRDEMPWKFVETSIGQLDSSRYDPYAQAIRAAGLKLLLVFDFANPLYDGGKFPASAGAQAAFAKYAAYLVRRYADILVAVELWNEPNGSFGFGYTARQLVPIYASLAAKVYPAVKAAAPSLPMMVGSSPLVGTEWLRALKSAGILSHCDAVSFHAYEAPDPVDRHINDLRAVVGTKPLWCTEFGGARPGIVPSYYKLLSIFSAQHLAGVSPYLLAPLAGLGLDAWTLIDNNGAITAQGAAFKQVAAIMPLTRASTSPLLPAYVGPTKTIAWGRLGRHGTLGGRAIGATPAIGTGTLHETGPAVVAELQKSWNKAGGWNSRAYNGTLVLDGFPFNTAKALSTGGFFRASDVALEPVVGVDASHWWVKSSTSPAGPFLFRASLARGAGGDGVTARVTVRGIVAWTAKIPPSTSVSIVGRAHLAVGQVIELRLGALASESFDSTKVELALTLDEPGLSGLAFNV